MKKRRILLLMLSAAALLLLTACGSTSAGSGSAHPYSWKNKGSDTLRLTVENLPQEGWSWVCEDAQSGSLTVEPVSESDKNAVFSVTGSGAAGVVRLACRRDTAPYDTSFRIELVLGTSEKGKLTVIDTSYTEYPAAGSAGEEGKPSCLWYTADDGSREVYLDSGDELYEWRALSYDSAYLSVEGPSYGEAGCTCRLTGLAEGETELLLYDTAHDYGFRLSVAVADDLSVTVTGCTAGSFALTAEQIPNMAEVTALVGELSFPQSVRVLECAAVEGWYGGGEKDCAELRVMADEKEWDLLITKSYSTNTLIWLCYTASDAVSFSQTAVGDYYWGTLCTTQAGQTLFWSDWEGRAYVLCALTEGASQELLLQTAASLSPVPATAGV